ncbi:transmembrane ascorbate-dependent reductase CYB561-like isoform X1 [Xyrauchen texanus]|uniref:transmembrane ascorbate-dependent reductase CYB561-like isoform X1 n=1 Tax=Xyrauchen texanus TaxID=154827 RepID=UPI002241ED61|nr:transmembrane ascorbate-dependent reductase CYB561-like isoform X1 [Xyrauchen texanus]
MSVLHTAMMENYKLFLVFFILALAVGFVSIAFVLTWVLHYREGLGWDGGAAEFNWHPLLMVIGLIFLQGIAIVVYRLPWTWKCSKQMMKFIHAGLNILAFILAVISVVAVFDFHNAKNIPNMYSLHSWVGLAVVILYPLQGPRFNIGHQVATQHGKKGKTMAPHVKGNKRAISFASGSSGPQMPFSRHSAPRSQQSRHAGRGHRSAFSPMTDPRPAGSDESRGRHHRTSSSVTNPPLAGCAEQDSYGCHCLPNTSGFSVHSCCTNAITHLQWALHLYQCDRHSFNGHHRETHIYSERPRL